MNERDFKRKKNYQVNGTLPKSLCTNKDTNQRVFLTSIIFTYLKSIFNKKISKQKNYSKINEFLFSLFHSNFCLTLFIKYHYILLCYLKTLFT